MFDEDTGLEIGEPEAIDFLKERKGFLDGVCITGGEPLLHKGLLFFLKKVKALGLLVKLDTNGSNPVLLKGLLDAKVLDYVAMDIKGSKKGYAKAAGIEIDLNAIEKSIELIKKSPDYEFRMTVVPGLHSEGDFNEIGAWLSGSKRFFLQQFTPGVPLLNKSFEKKEPFSKQELQNFAKILKPFSHLSPEPA